MFNSFGKGYAMPRPIISRTMILSALDGRYLNIALTMELLQNHPELFENIATNLIYLLQTGMNYKKNVIFDLFKSMFTTSYVLSDKDSNKMLNIQNASKDSFIETQSLLILFSYYVWKHKDFKPFEPSLDLCRQAYNLYSSNQEIYYKGIKLQLKELEPLCYNCNGDNLLEWIPYFCYIATFYVDGQPYKFFEEIGSESSYNGLLGTIDNYFGTYYKALLKDTGNESEMFVLKDHEKTFELLGNNNLKNMLSQMLNFDNVIELRNQELRKSLHLLEENFNDQSGLHLEFMSQRFKENMDTIVEMIIENNPINKLYNAFPTFEPMSIDTSMKTLNLEELAKMTQYVMAGNNSGYIIDHDYKFVPLQWGITNSDYDAGIIKKQGINKTSLNKFQFCSGRPFSDADIGLQICSAFVKERFYQQQQNVFTEPNFQDEVKIDESAFESEEMQQTLLNNFVGGLWRTSFVEMNTALSGLMRFNDKFKTDVKNILNLQKICSKVYVQITAARSIGTYLLSYLKEMILIHVSNNDDINTFNYFRYLSHYIYPMLDEDNYARINKIHDMLISIGFIQSKKYADIVNESMKDLSKYISNSVVQIPYLKGNADLSEIYSIGGLSMYDKMIDPNPFNRAYYFMRQTFGSSENIETFYRWVKELNDKTAFALIGNAASYDTVTDILNTWNNSAKKNPPTIIQNYLFTLSETDLKVVRKNSGYWVDLKVKDGSNVYAYLMKYMYKEVIGSYIDDIIVTRSLTPNDGFKAGDSVKKEFLFSNTKVPITISETGHDSYRIPRYKYVGDIKVMGLGFVNPPGHRLIQINLDSIDRTNNSTVFIFTTAQFSTRFDKYVVN